MPLTDKRLPTTESKKGQNILTRSQSRIRLRRRSVGVRLTSLCLKISRDISVGHAVTVGPLQYWAVASSEKAAAATMLASSHCGRLPFPDRAI